MHGPDLAWHLYVQDFKLNKFEGQHIIGKARQIVLFMFNFITTVTHFAEMKNNMIAIKATMDRSNVRLLLMLEHTPSAACSPEIAPMQQVSTDPASRTKWPIQPSTPPRPGGSKRKGGGGECVQAHVNIYVSDITHLNTPWILTERK